MKDLFSMGVSRRGFLKAGAAATASALAPRLLFQKPGPETNQNAISIGVQMYSIREDCRRDFDFALEKVAEMGFKGVEFAGYYQYKDNPDALRRRLDALGLKAAGTHIQTAVLKNDALPDTIDFHKIIGCPYLIVPSDPDIIHPEKSLEFADIFIHASQRLKQEGMFCGFHNHKSEFALHQGKTYWDLFAERTGKDVVLQLDVGWAATAGVDPVELIRKHPLRSRTVHFKPAVLAEDSDKIAIIGRDSIDWKNVIQACRNTGGTEWIIIEQEYYPLNKTPMECTRLSLEGLKEILKDPELI